MRLFFIKRNGKSNKKGVSDYKQEVIVKHGAQQFKELAKKGLRIKVALL